MAGGLEEMVNKNLVISDLHIPFQDKAAVDCMLDFAKQYKPDTVTINGDLVDFYSLSIFDRCPDRKDGMQSELYEAREFLHKLRKTVGESTKIHYLHGNHENRLQRFIWRNPELNGLDALKIRNLLELQKYGITQSKVDGDYWSAERGEVEIGGMTILHGDGRINRAKYSLNPGYSVLNTLKSRIGESLIMGHTHRMAQIYNMVGDENQIGMEGGCLCKMTRNNWQQGFITFSSDGKKSFDHKLHPINKGKLIENGKVYPRTKKKK